MRNLDAFGQSFLGLHGEPGAVKRFFFEAAPAVLALLSDPMSFTDYVQAEQIKRLSFSGNPTTFFREYATQRVATETAAEMAWQFAEQGAALGAVQPIAVRRLFDATQRQSKTEVYDRYLATGLDVPAKQDVRRFEEVEEAEMSCFTRSGTNSRSVKGRFGCLPRARWFV